MLQTRFEDVPISEDVRDLTQLPSSTELVTAGFPCQDLSQAGGTQGINGAKSGVVAHLFRLLERNDVPRVLIENVPFMLQLNRGQAIRYLVERLEKLGYNWAYRVINARSFGLPQRRERVFLLASRVEEPWHVLFAEEAPPRNETERDGLACGFYWTEGTRGLGWAVNAIPTLKGGSTIGIPSPPAIWLPDGRIVKPDIADAERLQGFPAGWTKPAEEVTRKGHRWKLVGNAVAVPAAEWIALCLLQLSDAPRLKRIPIQFDQNRSWPNAAFGSQSSERHAVRISEWPCAVPSPDLVSFLSPNVSDLSLRAVSGFIDRLTASSLRYPEEFLSALIQHRQRMAEKVNGACVRK